MKNTRELQLQRLALVLTVALVLQVVWSGARLLFLSKPEPIFPAESSLRVADISFGSGSESDDELYTALVSRPLFWEGRGPHVPAGDPAEDAAQVEATGSRAINKVKLLGVYTGDTPGIIVSYDGQRRRLRLDESIEDWTFTMMIPNGAVFESGDDSRFLRLEHVFPGEQAGSGARARVGVSGNEDSTDNNAEDQETGD